MMDPDFKPVPVRVYTVPRSVEQQLQPSKEIVRLVDIKVLEEDYSYEWASQHLKSLNKMGVSVQ
jgi:hypothetical protein